MRAFFWVALIILLQGCSDGGGNATVIGNPENESLKVGKPNENELRFYLRDMLKIPVVVKSYLNANLNATYLGSEVPKLVTSIRGSIFSHQSQGLVVDKQNLFYTLGNQAYDFLPEVVSRHDPLNPYVVLAYLKDPVFCGYFGTVKCVVRVDFGQLTATLVSSVPDEEEISFLNAHADNSSAIIKGPQGVRCVYAYRLGESVYRLDSLRADELDRCIIAPRRTVISLQNILNHFFSIFTTSGSYSQSAEVFDATPNGKYVATAEGTNLGLTNLTTNSTARCVLGERPRSIAINSAGKVITSSHRAEVLVHRMDGCETEVGYLAKAGMEVVEFVAPGGSFEFYVVITRLLQEALPKNPELKPAYLGILRRAE